MGTKIMLLGIAVILVAMAYSMENVIVFIGGLLGLLIAIIGLVKGDNNQTK